MCSKTKRTNVKGRQHGSKLNVSRKWKAGIIAHLATRQQRIIDIGAIRASPYRGDIYLAHCAISLNRGETCKRIVARKALKEREANLMCHANG